MKILERTSKSHSYYVPFEQPLISESLTEGNFPSVSPTQNKFFLGFFFLVYSLHEDNGNYRAYSVEPTRGGNKKKRNRPKTLRYALDF